MADEFKQEMTRRCCVGGLHCWCCNDYMKSGEKPILRRQARRSLKQETKKEIKKELNNDET